MIRVTNQLVQLSVEDINTRRRGRLLDVLLILVASAVVFTLVLAAFNPTPTPMPATLTIYQSGTITLMGLGLIHLANRYWSQLMASAFFLLFFVILLMAVDLPSEVIQGRTTFLLVLPILMASVLLEPRASFLFSVVIGALLYLLALYSDIEPSFISISALLLIGFVAWLSAQSLENALKDLRYTNQQLEQSMDELELAQERLIRQEKLAVLGQLAGSVGHELRNPLGVISNAVYVLNMTLENADELTKEYLDTISLRVKESDRIVADLLNLTRIGPADQEEIPVSDLVYDVFMRHPAPDNIAVTQTLDEGTTAVFLDRQQMGQVLANLVTNAYQAMPEGGTLRVRSEEAGDYILLSLRDSGHGMSEALLKRIFEPLFTTKKKGIGLGLVVSKNLVEANSGEITVVSQEGEGTTFTLKLPTKKAFT